MHQEMQSSSSDDGKRTSRQNTFARTWCAIQARWHNTEYPRRATLESINPIMCVKHRSRRPSLGRRILFIIYSEDNSQQRCAFGHDSVITKKQIIQKILRSDFDQEPATYTSTRRNSTSNQAESKTEHKWSFMSSIITKLFVSKSQKTEQKQKQKQKKEDTTKSVLYHFLLFFMYVL